MGPSGLHAEPLLSVVRARLPLASRDVSCARLTSAATQALDERRIASTTEQLADESGAGGMRAWRFEFRPFASGDASPSSSSSPALLVIVQPEAGLTLSGPAPAG